MKTIQLAFKLMLASSLVLLTACRKDDDKPLLPCNLKAVINSNGQPVNQYEYNAAHLLTKATLFADDPAQKPVYYTFTYDQQERLVKMINAPEGETEDADYFMVDYDSAGDATTLQLYTSSTGDSIPAGTLLLTYNQAHQPVQVESSLGGSVRFEYNWSGNVTRQFYKEKDGKEYLAYEYLAYDTKHNVYTNPFLRLFALIQDELVPYSQNNVLQMKRYNTAGTLIETYHFNYQYNANRYPVQKQYTIFREGNDENGSVRYEYNCQ